MIDHILHVDTNGKQDLISTAPPSRERLEAAKALIAAVKANPDDAALADYVRRFPKGPTDTAESIPPEDQWRAFTLADAYKERPPREYIAGKLFKVPSLNIVYGAPGSLKSLLLQDLAVCVAAGIPWLPPAPWLKDATGQGIPTKQRPVMWIDFDNGSDETHQRFSALARARNLPADIPLVYYSMPRPWLYATDTAAVGDLINRIKRQHSEVVFYDNLGNVTGDAEENSAEMGPVMSKFRQTAEETGAVQTLVHHQRKSNGTTGRAGETLRGHSSIEAALDLALLIEREDYSDVINIKATKVRGALPAPISASFLFEHKPGTEELHKASFVRVVSDDDQSDEAIEREILNILAEEPLGKEKLKKAVKDKLQKVGVNRIANRAERMAAEGKIKTKTGLVNNEKQFYL